MSYESEHIVPDYDDPKERWAFFGLAFYRANVLERGIVNLAVGLHSRGIPGVSRNQVDALYDSFNSKTFGQLLRVAKQQFNFSQDLADELSRSLELRNYFAHSFFVSHDIDLLSEQGKRKMIDELVSIAKFLKQVDRKVDPIWMSAWEHLGVTKDWVAKQMDRYVQERQRDGA